MNIPKRENYDGTIILLKKDCRKPCEFYRKIEDKEYCGWGTSFKVLVEPKKIRKCEVKNRDPPMFQSVEYLDKIFGEIQK